MDTLSSKIAELKAHHPTIKVGDDFNGYTNLNPEEYEAKIVEWAEADILSEQKQIAEKEQKLSYKIGGEVGSKVTGWKHKKK